MQKAGSVRKLLKKIADTLFPKKGGFDFSMEDPEGLFVRLPVCSDMRGATALSGRRAMAALSYKNRTARAMIWNIKFKRDGYALRCGGHIAYRALHQKMRETIKEKTPRSDTVPIIIPMPISPARRRERGYNQCELLAKAMLERAAFEHTKNPSDTISFELRTDILFRIKNIEKQTFKNRQERMENMKGAFAVSSRASGGKEILDRTVIIFDDVITTGSTMREAMDCLKRAEFKNVVGFGLAH